jgi:hypothetical protein
MRHKKDDDPRQSRTLPQPLYNARTCRMFGVKYQVPPMFGGPKTITKKEQDLTARRLTADALRCARRFKYSIKRYGDLYDLEFGWFARTVNAEKSWDPCAELERMLPLITMRHMESMKNFIKILNEPRIDCPAN